MHRTDTANNFYLHIESGQTNQLVLCNIYVPTSYLLLLNRASILSPIKFARLFTCVLFSF